MTYEQLSMENPDVDVRNRHFNSANIKGLYFNESIAINDKIDTYNERICILAEELGVTEQFLIECVNAYMHKYGCYWQYELDS